jgi:hypothetical protein
MVFPGGGDGRDYRNMCKVPGGWGVEMNLKGVDLESRPLIYPGTDHLQAVVLYPFP